MPQIEFLGVNITNRDDVALARRMFAGDWRRPTGTYFVHNEACFHVPAEKDVLRPLKDANYYSDILSSRIPNNVSRTATVQVRQTGRRMV